MIGFFTLSKLLWFVATPFNLLLLVALVGLALLYAGRRRSGLALTSVALAGQIVVGFSPLGALLMYPLEERFPLYRSDGKPVEGIILLGGAEAPDVTRTRGVPGLNDAGERVIEFVRLAREYPQARLVYSGGSGALGGSSGFEAESALMAVRDAGGDTSRIVIEPESRNTFENAQFSARMLKPAPGSRWILVTSAFHMPRAIGCFRAAGFNVIAAPGDFRTPGGGWPTGVFSNALNGFEFTQFALKEWIGLGVYYLTGKINELFPAPGTD